MESRKLISMVDYVLELETIPVTSNSVKEDFCPINKLNKITRYAKFLSRPLTLRMFVPTDENGNVLISIEEKEQWYRDHYDNGWWNDFVNYKGVYQKALSNVIFEGFELIEKNKTFMLISDGSNKLSFINDGSVIFKNYIKEESYINIETIDSFREKLLRKKVNDLYLKYDLTLTQSAITKYKI